MFKDFHTCAGVTVKFLEFDDEELLKSFFAERYGEHDEERLKRWMHQINEPGHIHFVLISEGRMVGFSHMFCMWGKTNIALLNNHIAILPAFDNEQYIECLTGSQVNWLKGCGDQDKWNITTTVSPDDASSLAAAEKQGFRIVYESKGDEESPPSVLLKLIFNSSSEYSAEEKPTESFGMVGSIINSVRNLWRLNIA